MGPIGLLVIYDSGTKLETVMSFILKLYTFASSRSSYAGIKSLTVKSLILKFRTGTVLYLVFYLNIALSGSIGESLLSSSG